MKKLFLSLLFLLGFTAGLFAQKMTYQAVIRDHNQQLVVSTPVRVSLTIAFQDGGTYDTVLTDLATNLHGLLTFEFGNASLSGRDWTDATIMLSVANADNASIRYLDAFTRPVSAVPYALSVNGQSIQNYLDAHHYLDSARVNDLISDTAAALRAQVSSTVPCGGSVVNICDLYALVDSIQRKCNAMQAQMNAMNDSLQHLRDTMQTQMNALNDSLQQLRDTMQTQMNALNDSLQQLRDALYGAPELGNITAVSGNTQITLSGSIASMGSNASYVDLKMYRYATPDYSDVPFECINGRVTSAPETYFVRMGGLTRNTPYYFVAIADNGHKRDTLKLTVNTLDFALSVANNRTDTIRMRYGSDTTVTYTATVTGEAGTAPTYHWQVNGADSASVTGNTLTVRYNTDGTYKVSCTVNDVRVSDTTVVETYTIAAAITSDVSGDTVNYCDGTNSIVYTATLTGVAPSSYEWSVTPASALHTSATSSTFMVTPQAVGTVTVTCKIYYNGNAEYVTANASTTIASRGTAAKIVVAESPILGTVSVKTAAEAGESTRNYASSYTWENSEHQQVGTANAPLQISTSTPEGIYTVVGVNSKNCNVRQQVVLGHASLNPCTGTANAGTELSGGLYANKEWTDANGNIYKVSDHQGNEYAVVKIGTGASAQCWLAENIRATTEPGSSTSIVQAMASGSSDSEPRAYMYDNAEANANKYGLLYNFPAAMNNHNSLQYSSFSYPHRGICPEGWHIPTEDEWNTLAMNAGCSDAYDSGTGAGKLTGGSDWNQSNTDATYSMPGNYNYSQRNASGFSALPAGNYEGSFYDVGVKTCFWSATPNGWSYVYSRDFKYYNQYIERNSTYSDNGCSVRCLRDE